LAASQISSLSLRAADILDNLPLNSLRTFNNFFVRMTFVRYNNINIQIGSVSFDIMQLYPLCSMWSCRCFSMQAACQSSCVYISQSCL